MILLITTQKKCLLKVEKKNSKTLNAQILFFRQTINGLGNF